MKFLKKLAGYSKRIVKAAYERVKTFVVSCYQHAEAVVILTLAAFGLNLWLGELPFYFVLPAFIEGALVIPVLSVLIISGLLRLSEFRATRRLKKVAI